MVLKERTGRLLLLLLWWYSHPSSLSAKLLQMKVGEEVAEVDGAVEEDGVVEADGVVEGEWISG